MPAWTIIILLLLLGFILLMIELFIIPGFGIVGISGLILLFVASYLSFKTLNVLFALALSIGSFALIIILIKFLTPRLSKSIALEQREEKEKGFSASRDYTDLLSKKGEAITPLRPSGIVLIEGKKVNVVSEGMFVSKGERVKVIKIEGSRIVVRKNGKISDTSKE